MCKEAEDSIDRVSVYVGIWGSIADVLVVDKKAASYPGKAQASAKDLTRCGRQQKPRDYESRALLLNQKP